MKIPSLSKKIWLVFSTMAIIGGFFAYYFLVYIENRQAELEAKKFRMLSQYSENIKNSYYEQTKRYRTKIDSIALLQDVANNCNACLSKPDKAKKGDSTTSNFQSQLQLKIQSEVKKARLNVIESTIKQSDFDELLFEVNSEIEKETFDNNIDSSILRAILKKDNAQNIRQVEFQVNNEDYIIFIQVFELDEKPWRIFGFCEKGEFLSQVRSVDLIYGITASLILILMLLMMPLLKLWVMNEMEKLRIVNVWFCGFSLVVGSSFLLLMVLMANDFFASYNSSSSENHRDARLRKISKAVEREFIDELRLMYSQIQESRVYDSLINKKSDCDGVNYNVIISDTAKLYGNTLDNPNFKFTKYPLFNELLWIKKNGYQRLIVATHHLDKTDIVNLTQRKYFSDALEDKSWIMPGSNGSERFALQSIHSYLMNTHEAGLGVKIQHGDSSGVLAMASKLNAVMNPLLPPGYQFAIIGNDGKVWFHSITDKNLSENFFDETEWDKRLLASVRGRDSVTLDIHYNRGKYRAVIRPIPNMELFLVTLHDNEFFNAPIVLTVGLAWLLIFMLFAIQGIHQGILIITSYRFSLLKINRFFLSWLRPQKDKLKHYQKAVLIQIILAIPIGVIISFYHHVYFVVCFLTLPVYLTTYHYFSLERFRIHEERMEDKNTFWIHPFLITSILLVLLINFSGYYYLGSSKILIVLGAQGLIVLVLIVSYFWDSDSVVQMISYRLRKLLFSITGGIMKLFWIVSRSSKSTNIIQRWKGIRLVRKANGIDNWYYAFLFLWLILASSMPTYYFYKIGYYEEGHIWLRHLQLTAAQQRETREANVGNAIEKFDSTIYPIKISGDYQATSDEFIRRLDLKTHSKTNSDSLELLFEEQSPIMALGYLRFQDILFKGAPLLKDEAERSRATVYPFTADGQWSWYEEGLSSIIKYKTIKGDTEYYKSSLAPYRLFKGDYWILLLVVNVLSILLLYRTLRFCITHIFGLGLLSESEYKIPTLSNGARYFVVGLPHSGKSKLIDEIKQSKKISSEECLEVDLNKDRAIVIQKNCKLVIALNFHLDINNHDINQLKLEKLEVFKEHVDVSVIIVSNLEPTTILEFYDKLATYYQKEKGDYELDGNYRKCKQAYRKWKNVLSAYSIHYHALKSEGQFKDKFIQYELNHGEYLPQLEHQLKDRIANAREREEMILQVEELALLYYQAIWNSLSCEEKFLLYDLAKDRFVNMRNMKIIRALRQKGLLVMRNSLYIMNKSFNNFILSVVVEDDEMKMEEEMRKKGSWNTLHLILVIAIVSIIAFLGIAQQEILKNFQGIIAVVGALLPLLARFGGIFSGTNIKE